MSESTEPMRCVPVPDDEVARRKALAVALYAQKAFPPLYRVSTMNPETLLHGSLGSPPVKTHYIFAGEDGLLHRPRIEIHTVEAGDVEAHAAAVWLMNFGSPIPRPSGQTGSVPVTVSGSSLSGVPLAVSADGWMVSVEAPDATLLVMGPGEIPRPLPLEPVDMHALKRSDSRYSGAGKI